ncbi:hypothetical protein F0562_020837 [Nyssa sinensis]|uniref:Uncharacterized protein n=1 Tax=Nyssa sinensis TaxID=561372 RepID=A0A5J5BVV3_9ASTE|nr:hypothetical protein F0562_020837 [Nyssa sinensis]
MEQEPQLSTQKIEENEDGGGGGDEEFYEKIEAPKFVDFTIPEPYRPDDRYWFCLRVGCDQKHEEEMDSEAIYKNFVLRVMAARSPNIRLQKALNRKAPSTNARCPLSAPAKPSKPRMSRLAVISSISQKIDAKVKVKPLAKLNSTPNVEAKQDTANTPLTKICEGMKRLQITSERKRVLGYSSKSSKDIRRNPNKKLPLDPSGKRPRAGKDKSRAKDSLHPRNLGDQETKSLRCTKGKDKENLNKHSGSKEMIEDDSSDMEIDVKSRDGSILGSSRVKEGNGREKHLETLKTSGNFDGTDSTQEEVIPSIDAPLPTENLDVMLTVDSRKAPPVTENSDVSEDSGGEMNTISNSGESDLEENDLPIIGAQNEQGDEGSEGIEQEEQTKSSSEQGVRSKDSTEYPTSEGVGHESEIMDNDDKENASAFDDNRNFNNNNNQFGGKILGRQDICENTKKVARKMDKNLKEELTVGNGAQGMRYKKPKPTNPKPFRLRTDRRDGNDIQRNEKCLEQCKYNNDMHEGSEKELEKNLQKDAPHWTRTGCLKTSKGQLGPKIATDNVSQKSENSLRKAKSPSLQRQLVTPQRVASTKAMVSYITPGQQLGVIKETSSTISRSKEAGKLRITKSSACAASRSSSRGRRPATIPKEPNFHSVHTPKSCTRKVA